MTTSETTVFVVDDDATVQRSLARVLTTAGYRAEIFSSAGEFLRQSRPTGIGCLVLDVHLPGLHGLELQRLLANADSPLPIIFITGGGDVPTSVQAIKSGAVDFLLKPIERRALLAAVATALAQSAERVGQRERAVSLQSLWATLTARERQVFFRVVAGAPNKQIAVDLGIGVRTVKLHRSRGMTKLRADSLAELVRIAGRLAALGESRYPDHLLPSGFFPEGKPPA